MHETHSTVTTLGITKLVKTRESINFESDSSKKNRTAGTKIKAMNVVSI